MMSGWRVEKNVVKQYSISGSYKRTYPDRDAVGVNVGGGSIAIRLANGKVKEYKASSGSYVKSYQPNKYILESFVSK